MIDYFVCLFSTINQAAFPQLLNTMIITLDYRVTLIFLIKFTYHSHNIIMSILLAKQVLLCAVYCCLTWPGFANSTTEVGK